MHDLARADHSDLDSEVRMNHLPLPVDVFIPSPDGTGTLGVRRGSAIAGEPARSGADDRLDIYYQDDAHGSMPTFADRAYMAAGRLVHRAPVVARASNVAASELLYVGVYDDRNGEVLLVDDDQARELLAEWIGVDVADLERERHTTTSVRHDQRRGIREALERTGGVPSPVVRSFARRFGHEDLLDPPAPTEET
jgi:hypothetical protein